MSEGPSSTPDEIRPDQAAGEPSMGKDKGALATDEGETSKKARGLLQVPSRSSSHNNQSSPASTGLSGPTMNESRNSIGGRSKDSKGSFLGRQRNGSASSKRTGGDSDPTQTVGNSQPGSPVQKRRKKKGSGILSLLGCCGSAETDDTTDGEIENAHKLQRLPHRPATSQSPAQTPQEQTESKMDDEKDTGTTQQHEVQPPSDDTGDRISPVGGGESSGHHGAPSVTVDPPKSHGQDTQPIQQQDVSATAVADVDMRDDAATEQHGPDATAVVDQGADPHQPAEGTSQTVPLTVGEVDASATEPPTSLLPEILPEHRGRKCLVLDLDETLVHSSFKVCTKPWHTCCTARYF